GPNRCFGAYVFDSNRRKVMPIRAKVTCVASGGAGQVYLHTTNPSIATGDGVAMAYRAGVTVANMEFIQFHPTSLYHPQANSFLISEALRGYGAVLRNAAGAAFMDAYHPQGSLAPRDDVARAIDREIKKAGTPCVYLDIRHAPASRTRRRFPTIYSRCRELGIDITTELVPVVPAAHYVCGGIRVDLEGNTSLPCLYACGESACTGVHGANRLASNSLLEALVYAKRAAENAGKRLGAISLVNARDVPAWDDSGTSDTEEWVLLAHDFDEIRTVMWDYVGSVRSDLRLQRARRRLMLLEREIEDYYKRTRITSELLDLRNIVTTAKLIVQSALRRRESRGLHYTTDYPRTDDRHWRRDTELSRRTMS
ncbi:MAG: FAD-binding protein, partial [Chitinivibrionales bacterium]|nr:FAD-binding protein [Chitinivibrionales bacterium]